MSDGVDFYEVQRMVDDERRFRIDADNALRELIELRNREVLEELASLKRLIQARTETP